MKSFVSKIDFKCQTHFLLPISYVNNLLLGIGGENESRLFFLFVARERCLLNFISPRKPEDDVSFFKC